MRKQAHLRRRHDSRGKPAASACWAQTGQLQNLAYSRWIIYTASMPTQICLEQEYRYAGLPLPSTAMETSPALATMSLIQGNANTVADLSSDVAAFFVNFGMACTLPMHLR